jgi:uncharacterized Fe-S cluster-containing MiaB family protein
MTKATAENAVIIDELRTRLADMMEINKRMAAERDEAKATLASILSLTQNDGRDTACLNAISSNEPCKPDGTLKRCTLCGFIVDTKYKAEFPK